MSKPVTFEYCSISPPRAADPAGRTPVHPSRGPPAAAGGHTLVGGSDEATERWVSDSLVLRQFCWVYAEPVPDDTTLLRWAHLSHPATLQHVLDHVVMLARSLKVTRGRKWRIDGTVVSPNIQHPTDRTLL